MFKLRGGKRPRRWSRNFEHSESWRPAMVVWWTSCGFVSWQWLCQCNLNRTDGMWGTSRNCRSQDLRQPSACLICLHFLKHVFNRLNRRIPYAFLVEFPWVENFDILTYLDISWQAAPAELEKSVERAKARHVGPVVPMSSVTFYVFSQFSHAFHNSFWIILNLTMSLFY